jgi:hypothetical protein
LYSKIKAPLEIQSALDYPIISITGLRINRGKKIKHKKKLKFEIFERRGQLRNRQHQQTILTECNLLAVFRQAIYVMKSKGF